ncbi:hypothetical protein CONPUDRAFT_134578 [Coniophora puteana RWD-64-598 SS2]|uniref:Protein kinase domain-containing protein n=1 Tax=Coniophora puteana (strain RWD-64-598) TaxID=741705 RepID=A0A5M3N9B3_CONPW|nr:uncharacterized protein CONPUDRAFT_134578 [Coniophora puteana RWD-64-598 SS2]EIW87431.1 hypothetical protein CONPUDRAFT_134578 [Coniophora puteana RWD-64-598 SS2]
MTDVPDPRLATLTAPLDSSGTGKRELAATLFKPEVWWAERYQWLKDRGYELRPRYRPGWTPSWRGTKKQFYQCEDGHCFVDTNLADAVCVKYGKFVMLKKIWAAVHPYEAEIGQFLTSGSLATHPSNHCIPILEVLQDPEEEDRLILVMPLLKMFWDPFFDTVGEVVEFCRQLFEGLKFMHDNRVAHRDCSYLNIMMDAESMFIGGWHPVEHVKKRDFSGEVSYYTRTKRPPKYYFIDFGLSRRYDPSTPLSEPVEPVIRGGDKTVPEHQDRKCPPQNPFRADIYCVGNVIKQAILQGTRGVEFLVPLIDSMTAADPLMRPSADDVVDQFQTILQGLGSWTLRSRIIHTEDGAVVNAFLATAHWYRRIGHVLTRRPPLPVPPS